MERVIQIAHANVWVKSIYKYLVKYECLNQCLGQIISWTINECNQLSKEELNVHQSACIG